MNSLNIKNITVIIDGHDILNNVSFNLPRGQLVGLIGPNGAGKSILLKSILGFIDNAEGQVFLDDKNLSDLSLKERGQKISYAAQGAPVYWPLNVDHLVSLGRIPHLSPWQSLSDKDKNIINDAMKKTDVLHLAQRNITSLSGGERARVMLARTIVSNSDYLLADEPIEALDPYHQIKIMEILKKLATNNHGIFVVLHDLNMAQKYCDQLILLKNGKIISQGKPHDVLTDKNLEDAYQIKVKRFKEGDQTFLIPSDLNAVNQEQ